MHERDREHEPERGAEREADDRFLRREPRGVQQHVISSGPCELAGSPSAWKIVWMCGIVVSLTGNGHVHASRTQIQRTSSQKPQMTSSMRTTEAARPSADAMRAGESARFGVRPENAAAWPA